MIIRTPASCFLNLLLLVAWHHRFVQSTPSAPSQDNLRTNVVFRRQDLLWVSPPSALLPFPLPVKLSERFLVGVNVLDVLKRETVERLDKDGNPVEETLWRLRPPEEFFAKPGEKTAEDVSLRKGFSTGGIFLEDRGDFILIEKRSSVSISTLVYRLAIGMAGSAVAASIHIGDLAAKAWERDTIRAEALYKLICSAKGQCIPDAKVLKHFKASASIAQIVEAAILREACQWLGVDPDAPIRRQRGRPRTRKGEDDFTTAAGKVIELSLQVDGTVTGRLIQSIAGFPQDTSLASLTLTKLAELLGLLRDASLVEDAELLEAYLDAVDADWRSKVAGEISTDPEGNDQNPWTILGLTPDATLEEVKEAYRNIMQVIHPDRKSAMPQWFAQTVNNAYRQIKERFNA